MHTNYDQSTNRASLLTTILHQQIAEVGGAISFAQFMETALYHPQWGYYQSPTFNLGKAGDFVTAPELSPLFARCFATPCQQLFQPLGTRNVLELGAGSGRFAYALLLELEKNKALPEHYFIYDVSLALREKQQQFLLKHCPHLFHLVTWLDTLPATFSGIVIANEVLDALPIHLFHVSDHGILEKCVASKNNQFHWQLTLPTSSIFETTVTDIKNRYALPVGFESEVNLHLTDFVRTLCDRLEKGVMLFADYGYGQRELYRPSRQGGTLACYYHHHRQDNPLILVGQQDITASVDFTRLAEAGIENGCDLLGYTTQAAFLFDCGLIELVAQDEANLSSTELFQQKQALKMLTLPNEMGERIKVMAFRKNIDLSLGGFGMQDCRRDL